MIFLRSEEGLAPSYMTRHSSCADLRSRISINIKAHSRCIIPTGVWIDRVDWQLVPENMIPELQIRARSGLSLKTGLMLANGIGTIDADYTEEIGVIFFNTNPHDVKIKKGDRIAQITLALNFKIPRLEIGLSRTGGFGSTGAD